MLLSGLKIPKNKKIKIKIKVHLILSSKNLNKKALFVFFLLFAHIKTSFKINEENYQFENDYFCLNIQFTTVRCFLEKV